jgi:hypothetical protein
MPNKTINHIRFAHWEKASLSLYFFLYVSTINKYVEAGLLPPEPVSSYYILSLLMLGLFVVLNTCFRAFERYKAGARREVTAATF